MSLATEILLFPTSQAYRDDPQKVFEKVASIIGTKEGHIVTYHGPQIEDNKKAYSILLWNTLEDHQRVMKAPDYKDVGEALALATVKEPAPEMFHVHFSKDPRPILEKPVTEVARFTFKEGKTLEDSGPLAEKLLSLIEKAGAFLTWGQTVEKENEFFALLGWESVEHHLKTLRESPNYEEIKAAGARFFEVANNDVGHTALYKFQ